MHDYPIVSIAPEDGNGLPEIYHVEKDFQASPWQKPKLGQKIKMINGRAPHDYMADFIQNSPEALDYVDPDARYNAMLYGYPEGKSRGRFARRNMWNGEDIRITWENGTDTIVGFTMQLAPTMGMYKDGKLQFEDTKTLTELCFLSDDELSNGATKRDLGVAAVGRVGRGLRRLASRQLNTGGDAQYAPDGFPTPLAYSKEYAMATYAVPGDNETVVLNIRTFTEKAMTSSDFVRAMAAFVKEQIVAWKKAGFKRLIIDVSGNDGGKAILPFDILKQLFPADDDFPLLNMHWSPVTWAYMYGNDEHSLYRDVHMADFRDMKDMLGPVAKDGGWFTKMWKQDYVQLGKDTYDLSVTPGDSQHFQPADIAVISDSLCASACHSLVESLRARGVRTFAYGGRPIKSSPMQAVGGTKGGRVLQYESVRTSLGKVASSQAVIAAAGHPDTWLLKPLPVRTGDVTVNTENKFRSDNQLPLQFVYTPACNRFFMDATVLGDIAQLWRKTREMAWDKDGKAAQCVKYTLIDNQSNSLEAGSSVGGSGGRAGAWAGYTVGRMVWERMRGSST